MKRSSMIYVVLSLFLLSCSDEGALEDSTFPKTKPQVEENQVEEPIENKGKGISAENSDTDSDTNTDTEELAPAPNPGEPDPVLQGISDPELLGITAEEFNIVMGKPAHNQKERAEEAIEASKTVLIFLKIATKEELSTFNQDSLADSEMNILPIAMNILGKIAIFLGGFNSLKLLNMFSRPGANSEENCRELRDSINSIDDQVNKKQAWALARFVPHVLDAINKHYGLFTSGINRCEWNKL